MIVVKLLINLTYYVINIILITIIGLTILYIHKNKTSLISLSGPIIGVGLFVLSLLFPNIVSMDKAKDAIENVLAQVDI